MIFRCPECDAKLELPDGSEGRKARCPHCEEVIVVAAGKPSETSALLRGDEEDSPRPKREGRSSRDEVEIGDGDLEAKAKTAAGGAARRGGCASRSSRCSSTW